MEEIGSGGGGRGFEVNKCVLIRLLYVRWMVCLPLMAGGSKQAAGKT
jgi:hypothetical protein